jgi:ribosomal-protein-alanine N-acetyltransferase
MSVRIFNLAASDIPDVLDISIECRLCLWSHEAYRSEITRDDSIMLKLVNADNGETAGFAAGRIFDFGAEGFTAELTNIGLRSDYRAQGNGTKLMRGFVGRCRDLGAAQVILEVRESNSTAIAFYGKLGFRIAGRRRGFYADPFEDGLTMTLALDDKTAVKNLT